MLVALLAITDLCMNTSLVYYIFATGGSGLWVLLVMRKVNLKDLECFLWSQNGGMVVRGMIALGLLGEYLRRIEIFCRRMGCVLHTVFRLWTTKLHVYFDRLDEGHRD